VRIKLLKYRRFLENGRERLRYPGEIIDVKNKALISQLVDQGVALVLVPKVSEIPEDAGLVLTRPREVPPGFARHQVSDPCVPYAKTMIWYPQADVRLDLVSVGLRLLERWEIAVPLVSYTVLANTVGTDEDRERTEAVIRDLRVPVYDPRLVFVRKGTAGEETIMRWQADNGNMLLAFLRALYAVKPLVCALPQEWINA